MIWLYPSRCSVIVTGVMKHVYQTLNSGNRVHFPQQSEKKFSGLVQRREPRVTDVIGFTDVHASDIN